MTEFALRYEYVIRAAHKTGRLGIAAAHADAYRVLERNFIRNRDNTDNTKNEELLFEYAFYCGELATNLNNALDAFENNFDITDIDNKELGNIEEILIYAEMDEIEKSVILFENILKRHKLIV